jgi:prepilin-type N-terminal cleavage/methylation domain-containing protein
LHLKNNLAKLLLCINQFIFLQMNNSLNIKKYHIKKAFSLIELSVVVLIIGILIAGITQSSRLVRAMKLNTARSLTRSSDVNSIRNLTAWFDSTAEGVFSSSCTSGSQNTNLTSASRVFDINTSTGNPSVTTPSSAYIMPEHRQVIRLWKDSSPQDTDADKVILEYAQTGNCTTQNYSVGGTAGVDKGPMYHNSGLAGLPSIYFDGGDNSWFSSINPVTMPIAPSKKDFSIFTVYRTDPDYESVAAHRNVVQFSEIGSVAGSNPAILAKNADAGTANCGSIPSFTWSNLTNACDTSTARGQNALYVSKPSIEYAFGVAIDATTDVTLSSANTKIYLNSSSPVSDITIGSAMISSGAPTLGDTVTSQLNIGGGYNGIFKGFISEVLIFDRKITNEEASSVMSYLIKKYNLKAL